MRVSPARRISGTIAGILLGLAIVVVFDWAGSALFPLPGGLPHEDKAAVAVASATLPPWPLVLVLAGWFFATFVAALMGRRIAHSRLAALAAASVIIACGAVTMVRAPHPVWFVVAAVAAFTLATWGGWRLGSRAVVER